MVETVIGDDRVDWLTSGAPVPYGDAVAAMQRRVAEIHAGRAAQAVWLLEHPPLYTAGASARAEDLLDPGRFPVFASGRGGQYTYHGPGQRVAYVMLDLTRQGGDLRAFVRHLEDWLIATLARFAVKGERRSGRVGIWVVRGGGGEAAREDKIAAIGLHIRHWISFHGVSINVAPDLEHFAGIVPCGVAGHGVTSLRDLGSAATLAEVDRVLKETFEAVFGLATAAPRPFDP